MSQQHTITVDRNGLISLGNLRWRCALGKGGIRADKHEGDGATPVGTFRMIQVYYRPDRLGHAPVTALPTRALSPNMGWCDDPTHADYNQLITLPHPAHYEKMWRNDHLYDIVVELDHNQNPIVRGAGSAIFMHVARHDYASTEGCIALNIKHLEELLSCCDASAIITIPHPGP